MTREDKLQALHRGHRRALGQYNTPAHLSLKRVDLRLLYGHMLDELEAAENAAGAADFLRNDP